MNSVLQLFDESMVNGAQMLNPDDEFSFIHHGLEVTEGQDGPR